MSQSLKTQWQLALQGSGLGLNRIGAGLIMSLHAKPDGSAVWPAMEDEADRVGCNRKTLEGHRTALVTLGWLVFVAGPVPGYRGTEYRLTIPEHAQKTGTLEASAVTVLPTERDRSTESVTVLRTEHAQKPHINMTENMTSTNMSFKT